MKRRAEDEDDDHEEWPKRREINRAEEQDDHKEWLDLALASSGYKPKPPSPSRSVPIQPAPLMSSTSALSPQAPSQETFFAVPPHHLPSSRLSGVLPLLPASRIPSQQDQDQDQDRAIKSRPEYAHRLKALEEGKSETITPPYPWATSKRARVYSLEYLSANGMNAISGTVQCKHYKCKEQFEIRYDLQEKFVEVAEFFRKNKDSMHDRAPSVWMNPVVPNCEFCGKENCAKPVIHRKKSINWLFLLLGQMLGCCNVEQLKYFCKHTRNSKEGTKDRLLFLTYLGLCRQLHPNGNFDI